MTDVDTINLALGAALAGVGAAFVLTILGGLTFWALDLVRGLWGGRS